MNVKKSQIKQLRQKYDLTQDQMAEIAGYTKRQWQNFEYGVTPMRKILFNAIRAELEKVQ